MGQSAPIYFIFDYLIIIIILFIFFLDNLFIGLFFMIGLSEQNGVSKRSELTPFCER